MTSEHGPVLPMEQKCVRSGHWVIEGCVVTASWLGRARNKIGSWTVETPDGQVTCAFPKLDDARWWIRENWLS